MADQIDYDKCHFKNGRLNPHTTRVNISASNPPEIEIFLSKYTFSEVLIKNKLFLNTLIQQNNKHFTDSGGGHFTKWPTKYEYVIISSNPPKIEIF